MKLNFDYYKEELDNKEIPEEFEEVYEKVLKCKSDDFSDMIDSKSKIKNIFALSNIRENVFNWYDFKNENNDATILELNCNYGEITGLLCNKCSKVVSIENSKKFSELVEIRHKNKENLELIVGQLQKIEIKEKFDYVVIVGISENIEQYIEYAKDHLKDNGIILLAIDNRFGMKSWITVNDAEKIINNKNITLSRKQIKEIFKDMNFRLYYPLPDYKLPNIIYTEKNLPNINNINRDLTYKNGCVNFKEIDAYRSIVEEDPELFKFFANSIIVEASKNKLEENDIKFITFSNIRKDKYRIKTIVKDEYVYKSAVNEKSEGHIENVKNNIELLNLLKINNLDSYKNAQIISKYTTAETLEDKFVKLLQENNIEKIIKEINIYREFLINNLEVINDITNNVFDKYKIEYDTELIQKLTFVKHGFWDLIFQNCFIIDDKYYFYDQEWYEENIPVEYILYRAILYFTAIKKYISDEEMFKKIEIIEYIDIFKELDKKIQEKIRKPLVWKIHTKNELINEKYNKKLEENKVEIETLKAQRDALADELAGIKDSISWKIIKPLRTMRKTNIERTKK